MKYQIYIDRYIFIILYITIFSYSYTLAQENISNVVISKTVEDAHYDFLKELHDEEYAKAREEKLRKEPAVKKTIKRKIMSAARHPLPPSPRPPPPRPRPRSRRWSRRRPSPASRS